METKINNAVFPACQGGPHNNVSFFFVFPDLSLKIVIDDCGYCRRSEAGRRTRFQGIRDSGHQELANHCRGATQA